MITLARSSCSGRFNYSLVKEQLTNAANGAEVARSLGLRVHHQARWRSCDERALQVDRWAQAMVLAAMAFAGAEEIKSQTIFLGIIRIQQSEP